MLVATQPLGFRLDSVIGRPSWRKYPQSKYLCMRVQQSATDCNGPSWPLALVPGTDVLRIIALAEWQRNGDRCG